MVMDLSKIILEPIKPSTFRMMHVYRGRKVNAPDNRKYARVLNSLEYEGDRRYETMMEEFREHPFAFKISVKKREDDWTKKYLDPSSFAASVKKREDGWIRRYRADGISNEDIALLARIAKGDPRKQGFLEIKLKEGHCSSWKDIITLGFEEDKSGTLRSTELWVPYGKAYLFDSRIQGPCPREKAIEGVWVPDLYWEEACLPLEIESGQV
jgi:hypothetical protein